MDSMAKTGRNKGSGRFALVLFLVFLLLLGLAACLILQRLQSPSRAVVGRWRMELACTDDAVSRAESWLRDAQLGDRVEAAELFPALHVDVVLTLRRDGSWERSLDEASYAAAQSAAVDGMAASARQLLRLRVAATGRGGGPDEYAEQLMQDALGMSSSAYFASYGPQLLPSPDQLREHWNGSGAWTIADGRIDLGGGPVDFLVGDSLLVLSGPEGTEVYTRDDAA